ncbi:MAG TPA: DUF3566 domain-containing protein [Thermoanaerobaculia bacterium]|nr:DUF3566 domain-containing protein [Thermoanaerobaculia bacterium]
MVIRRVGPLSLAKVTGVLYAFLGLIIGGIFSLISMVGSAFAPQGTDMGPMGMVFGAAAIVAFPLFYGVLGFISSLIGAAIYNLVAGWVGGVELEVQ